MPGGRTSFTASSYLLAGSLRSDKTWRDGVAGRKCLFQRLVQKLVLHLPCVFSERLDWTFLLAKGCSRPSRNTGFSIHRIFSKVRRCFSAQFAAMIADRH